MRVWSLHPGLLDRAGLIACWRETLLAQAVLAGRTRGYRNHPQLIRFRATDDPVAAIGVYLTGLADEADRRGYRFDRSRIDRPGPVANTLEVTAGQLAFEAEHLHAKLGVRSPETVRANESRALEPHPLFLVVPGPIAAWERP
ncbi:DNA lyase [Enemella dayhoffiae]|uniref:DNA lyase n=1 Tax=Enemella dayhoffiae TaxID=2016507 RepID=A0A255H5E7_9ACTN|nr:pyrimidine dimer DNA glycosylase/endonuclease V [Enemella dayhoffiae]OYO22682.1 DNA lyase [Enemella dayhoffiae]